VLTNGTNSQVPGNWLPWGSVAASGTNTCATITGPLPTNIFVMILDGTPP
jgi:hypothetical protein